jgi:hypothetical protein
MNPVLDGSVPVVDGSPSTVPDAAQPVLDAAPDAPSHLPVTVLATAGALPLAGLRVVFHDANGAVLETKLTGADGKATSTGAIPAMATAILADGESTHLYTWMGVASGDVLQLERPVQYAELGQYTVTLPGPFGTADEYFAYAGVCSGEANATSATIGIQTPCVAGTQASVLASAYQDGQIQATSFKKANAIPNDGGAVAVTTGAWTAPVDVTVTMANAPDTEFNTAFAEIANGVAFRPARNAEVATSSATFKAASGFADALQVITEWSVGPRSSLALGKRFTGTAAVAFDAANALPSITASEIDETNVHRPVVSWTTDSTAGADGGLVRIDFGAPSKPPAEWVFIVAPGTKQITAPAMPPEAEIYLPVASDAGGHFYGDPEVLFIEADVLPSYTLFRQLSTKFIVNGFAPYPKPPLPQDGNYRMTRFVGGSQT